MTSPACAADRGGAVLLGSERLLAAAEAANLCGYPGLAASLERIQDLLTALPATHARHLAEAIVTGAVAGPCTTP